MRTNRPLLPILFIACMLCLASGCEEEVLLPQQADGLERYYPLELNRPAYYRVDSVVLFNTVGGIRYDTARVEARETLVETFIGADGRTVYRGERWERHDSGEPFVYRHTFTVDRQATTITRSEDNLEFIKLVAPVRTGVQWDGHAAFDDGREVSVGGEFLDVYLGWQYEYSATGESVALGTGLTLDSVITVTQAETENLLDLRVAYERYAPGVGLVERFIDARHTQCKICCGAQTDLCVDLPWEEKAEKGYVIRQTLLRRD